MSVKIKCSQCNVDVYVIDGCSSDGLCLKCYEEKRKVRMECNMCGKEFSGSYAKIVEDIYCIDCAMKLEKITKDMCSKCERRGESDPGNFKCDEIPRPVHAKGYKCKNCDTLTEGKIMCAICGSEFCEHCVYDVANWKCPKCAEIKEDELKVGDVVQLKSGSPIMTITSVEDSIEGNIARCEYYFLLTKVKERFLLDCLEKVEVE